MKLSAVLGMVAFCFAFSAKDAQAQYDCDSALYGAGGTYGGAYDGACTQNQASTVSTSVAVLRTAAVQSAKLVSNRVSAALGGDSGVNVASNGFSASTGIPAGNYMNNAGVWVAGSWTDVENDQVDTAFEGDVFNVMAGVDVEVSRQTVIGLAVGWEDSDFDTEYNGFGGNDGNVDGDGYTIAPYIGVKLAPNASADLTIGYSDLEYDTERFNQLTGASVTGSTDADRYFVNASVSGSHEIQQRWHLRGKGTIFYASEERDAFTETNAVTGATTAVGEQDVDLGQILIDAKLGYLFRHVEPYALAGVEFDFAKDDQPVGQGQSEAMDDDFGAKFGAGVDLRLGPNVTGGVEAYTVEFRDDYDEYTFRGGLRVDF